MTGGYTTGNYCPQCASGGHWGGWLPQLFTAHQSGAAAARERCAESGCVEAALRRLRQRLP